MNKINCTHYRKPVSSSVIINTVRPRSLVPRFLKTYSTTYSYDPGKCDQMYVCKEVKNGYFLRKPFLNFYFLVFFMPFLN